MYKRTLTSGSITKNIFIFACPMILGNVLQQVYNLADTYIVGRFISDDALASVGGVFTLTGFIYSVMTGLSMGCGALVSFYYGQGDYEQVKKYTASSVTLICTLSICIELAALLFSRQMLRLIQTPERIIGMTDGYVKIVFAGIVFVALYDLVFFLLSGLGNSVTPLVFLGLASVMNVILDLLLVVRCDAGVNGAAVATLVSQIFGGLGMLIYLLRKEAALRFKLRDLKASSKTLYHLLRVSGASAVQQSIMNFGILLVQGLINSFGTTVMAAYAIVVKIDTLAYMPAQEYGNAFSLFTSQNYGAGQLHRIKKGLKSTFFMVSFYCALASLAVYIFAEPLIGIFIKSRSADIISIGVQYLHIEGMLYALLGILVLFYGYYRGINRAEISLLLTIISLGTRVVLAYTMAPVPNIGVKGIWMAIPIGWLLADIVGLIFLRKTSLNTKK